MTTLSIKTLPAKSTRYGLLLMLAVSFIWAVMDVVLDHIGGAYSLYQVVWVRYATHLLFILLVFGPQHGVRLVYTRRLPLQLLRGVMMFIIPVSYIVATRYIEPKNILFIFWLAPLITLILSVLFWRENASLLYWLAALGGLIAMVFILHPNRPMAVIGILLSLVMAVSFSLYLLLTRVLKDEPTLTNLFYTAISVLVPLSFGLFAFWQPLTLRSGLLMAVIGLFGFWMLWAMDKALEMASPVVVAPILFAQPLWLILLIYLVERVR